MMMGLKKIGIEQRIEELRRYVEGCNFSGYDPYDALNSSLLRLLSGNSKWGRTFFLQVLKRLPLNVRPLLGISKGHNPKAIGLFLWSYAKLYHIQKKTEYLDILRHLLGLLDQLKSHSYSGYCWGYNFDWQSRAFFAPQYTPTIVNSSLVGHGLLDAYMYTGIQEMRDMAISIKDFLLNDLNIYQEGDTLCFSYTPIDHSIIHNSNMLGASLLVRIYKITGDKVALDKAIAALKFSLKYQQEDGSWYYGTEKHHHWIDSFHTGFNLQSIYYFLSAGLSEFQSVFDKGVDFYVNNFFLQDGTPKYYHHSIYPIDIHSPSQALAFFSLLAPKYDSLQKRIAMWMLENLYDSTKGYFYFQKKKYYVNKIPYIRWSQAWAFHALTSFLLCGDA